MNVDLHMHSNVSDDGQYSPTELVGIARDAGVGVISLTDHNTTAGVAEAMAAGRDLGVDVIPGVELDALYDDTVLHILGYFVDHSDTRYAEIHARINRAEMEAGERRLAHAAALGLAFDREALLRTARDRGGVVTPEVVAEFVLDHPDNRDKEILKPYRPGGAHAENPFVDFYWNHFAPGTPGHIDIPFLTFPEAVDLILVTGGVPVLAHPGAYLVGREEALSDIMRQGVVGLEVYSGYHDEEARRHWLRQAERFGINLITCGSDFHGRIKPKITMGSHGDPRGDQAVRDLRSVRDSRASSGERGA
ncbi:MAG: PHP domain-containing protein [Planctomycetes bacterium]|nr:PHP domain-containing protein [Planctomycetota bacterium]MCC8116830.1 PHP domain-containing protein [Planctomycetota bacterium]